MKVTEMRDDQIVAIYIQLRDRRAQRKAAYDLEDAEDKGKMEKLEQLLLERFQTNGQESVRTANGTAYKKLSTSAKVADWPILLDFVKKNEAWDFLERRVSKSAVESFKDEHQDLPPGVSWYEEITIGVRRS